MGAMIERPILFSAPMIRAILNGTKTQTRRTCRIGYHPSHGVAGCPYGQPGGRLWVRERWMGYKQTNVEHDEREPLTQSERGGMSWNQWVEINGRPHVEYFADGKSVGPWAPSIHMPRWASRITLEVTEVRVQRLQSISDEDARAEGVEPYTPPHGHISPDQRVPGPGFDRCRLGDQPHRLPFADLWDRINGKRSGAAWESNPWVWAVTFKVVPK